LFLYFFLHRKKRGGERGIERHVDMRSLPRGRTGTAGPGPDDGGEVGAVAAAAGGQGVYWESAFFAVGEAEAVNDDGILTLCGLPAEEHGAKLAEMDSDRAKRERLRAARKAARDGAPARRSTTSRSPSAAAASRGGGSAGPGAAQKTLRRGIVAAAASGGG
jgi:hypothetical protein